MAHIELEKDLIAILLVVESVHDKNRVLYKYEEIKTYQRSQESISFYTPYAIVIAKDFDPPSVKEEDASRSTFLNFDETTLSILTTPYSYGNHVEVQVDDVTFVGHTLRLEGNLNLKSFAIFFALRAIAKASVILSYQDMSKRIGTAIRCEEQRASYLNQEYLKLISIIQQYEAEENDPANCIPNEENTRERDQKDKKKEIYITMAQQSPLAATLRQIYIDLQVSGEINISINNWLNVSCCLPHRSVPINCPLETDYFYNVLSNAGDYLKPYYGLLLVIDPLVLLASLPMDSSQTLATLIKTVRSSHSLSSLSLDTGIQLSQIYSLTAHLLFWGRAKIIYPIAEDNIYIISPDADLSKQGSLSKMYHETFQNTSNYPTLQEALAEYSDAIAFHDHVSRCETENEKRERHQCVEWLLRHRLLVQVHNYFYVLLSNDERHNFKDEFRKLRLRPSRAPLQRYQFSIEGFGSSSKHERFHLTSESIDIRGNTSSINGFEYNMASSPMASALSHSSTYNSKSADTIRTLTDTSHEDVFASGSVSSSTTGISNRISLHYLPQITQALPDERAEYRQRLASAIKDAKEQHVVDFLKLIKYLDGNYHLEEIASLENITRLQILTVLENFQSIVVSALHPDPNPILQI
ncbi:unnamed protein product [Rotaria magnacalcarata]|uniref:GATOR complex protein NPRL3 n=3 Tax=Rotaria magnacalcarata TaxID=392030 RepID=A0A819SD52_9BILA|nr:unnamed protein product [Rotaria magnacalcarata]CAF1681991.1 unnamed protein product [Rotaria magnacalcarata]CAF2049138.1 unnamed protein product [Rotaria magnacalcarata]CAF2138380.1 unnamed protein product [Rotaria magnacalcarata]CAF3822310.1 unnamed protein product [Rotaria magnacalcarata]